MVRVKQSSDPGLSGILEIIAQKVGWDVHDQSSADLQNHGRPCPFPALLWLFNLPGPSNRPLLNANITRAARHGGRCGKSGDRVSWAHVPEATWLAEQHL